MENADLHRYVRTNRPAELEQAIARGANVNEKDEFGATPLLYAITEKNPAMVARLLSHGADVTVQDDDGSTPLHAAIEHGLYRVAEGVITENPKVVAIPDRFGNEPLWTAVFNARGTYDIVRLLLANGANPNHRNEAGASPVDLARRIGDDVLVGMLELK